MRYGTYWRAWPGAMRTRRRAKDSSRPKRASPRRLALAICQADASELAQSRLPAEADDRTTSANTTSPVDRWLDWLLPCVRARLGRALGLADADEVAELLLVIVPASRRPQRAWTSRWRWRTCRARFGWRGSIAIRAGCPRRDDSSPSIMSES